MASNRSTIDCVTCQTKSEGFNETKLNKELHGVVGESGAKVHRNKTSSKDEGLDYDLEALAMQYSMLGTPVPISAGTQLESTDISNQWQWASSLSSNESPQHSCSDTITSDLFTQAYPGLITQSLNINMPLVSRSPTNTGSQEDVTTRDSNNPERAAIVVYRELVLDRTAENNALPFVLQGYAAWVNRLALDPLKVRGIVRDLVFSHFKGGEQSRWIIALLANIGSRVGSVELVEGGPNPMLSMLQTTVRRQIGAAKLCPRTERHELVKTLDSAIETILMHFFVGSVSEAMVLRQEAAPVFRQLCPGPANTSINLPLILQHPFSCLRHYAHIDIMFSIAMDIPTTFPYEVAVYGSLLPNPYWPALARYNDGIIQWMHGTPNEMILLFAKMNTMRRDGQIPDREIVASLVREIRALQPFDGSSSERFLAIVRSVIHECWRQAAYIYLYMAVCEDSADTPRVQEAFKRYMRLLNGTQPGRLPDEFLILTLQLASIYPAAQRHRDRKVIKRRVLRLSSRDRTRIADNFILFVMNDVWARADAEERPVVWSDLAVSRKRLLGV